MRKIKNYCPEDYMNKKLNKGEKRSHTPQSRPSPPGERKNKLERDVSETMPVRTVEKPKEPKKTTGSQKPSA